MVVRSGVGYLVALATVALVALLLVGVGSQPVLASDGDGARVTETTEADAAAGGAPSGTAGLSLLIAAVAATVWNVALGERRARQRTPAHAE